MNIDINLYNLRESLDEYLPADKAYAIKPSKLLWILNKLRDTEEELQAAESKLEEMEKAVPCAYINDIGVNRGFRPTLILPDAFDELNKYCKPIYQPLFLHPQVQSNADKEIIDEAVNIIVELSLDLEHEINNKYEYRDIEKYPSQKGKYDRDMAIVRKSRSFVRSVTDPITNLIAK